MPSSISWMVFGFNSPAFSRKNCLSRVIIWETLTTDSLDKPLLRGDSATFPGAAAKRTFELSATTTTVPIRLRLNTSDCTTTTGRVNPGSEAAGSAKSTHHISPRFTIVRWAGISFAAPAILAQYSMKCSRRLCRVLLVLVGRHSFRDNYGGLEYRAGCVTCRGDGLAFRPTRILCLVWIWLFSYLKYNFCYTILQTFRYKNTSQMKGIFVNIDIVSIGADERT
jgi:hypothetical protein